MSKVCKHCHEIIEDESRKFCPVCGEIVDSELKLALEMEKIRKESQTAKKQNIQQENVPKQKSDTHPSAAAPIPPPAQPTAPPVPKPANNTSKKILFIAIPILLLLVLTAAFFLLK